MSVMDLKLKYLNSIKNEVKKCPKITLEIGGKRKLVLLDSGASSSVLDFSTLLSLGYNKKNLKKENIPFLVDASKNFLNVLGTINFLVKCPCKSHESNRSKIVKFIVVKTLNIPIILGNEDCRRLKLVSYNCNSVNVLTEAETFRKKTHCPPPRIWYKPMPPNYRP